MLQSVFTIQVMLSHFRSMYKRRNGLCMSGLNDLLGFLQLAVGDLQDRVRKGDREGTENALASVVAWISAVAIYFDSLPLPEAMAKKYPSRCSYCQAMPCACTERRPDSRLVSASSVQINWSFADWCDHLDRLYGEKNRVRGIDYTVIRLFKEECEIRELAINLRPERATLDEREMEYALEISDALAWTIAAANVLGLPLESVIIDRFGARGPTSTSASCECPLFVSEDGHTSRVGSNTRPTLRAL